MKSHAAVAVIGGGVVGCSVLYHLAKLGCSDAVLFERKDLTAGSSWHAAGGFHAFNSDPGVTRLQAYTMRLYGEIEAFSGQAVGIHRTGGLLVAETRERWDFLRADWARQRALGLETVLLSPAEVKALCPIMDVSSIRGALYSADEGHLDPYGATHAYAKAARRMGAEIHRHNRVLELKARAAGGWLVVTEQGSMVCDHVVNAAGLWAREVGRMAGVELPLLPMEHHYVITGDLPELEHASHELPGILDLDGEIYLRQERKGILLGVYEKEATPWALEGTPWDYGEAELLPPQLDRLTDSLAKGFQRFPTLSQSGMRRIVNGPFTFTPDGNPLVGPVPGLKDFWAACGVMAGFSQGGGVGLSLAQWILQGEPEGDIGAMDVARFGPYATRAYTRAKACEFYSRRFQIAYPNEYWPAGRPSKVSPVHAAMRKANAVFGVSYGREIPLYFAAAGEPAVETPTLRRSNAFAKVREECLTARAGIAILDISSFAQYEVEGPEARAALDVLLAGRLPQPGRVRLTPMLAPSGRLAGDLTTMCLGEGRFRLGGSGSLQAVHMRWFARYLRDFSIEVRNISDETAGLALIGPRARALLARLTRADVSNEALPFMSVTAMELAFAPALVARVSVSGELGYEIYVPSAHLAPLLEAILDEGEPLEARLIGTYALNSLRLEKSFGIWSREFSADYTPRMCGLDRFIDYDKPAVFVGREAAFRDRATPPARRLITLAIDATDADASGYEPIWCGSQLVGFLTSGGYGHVCERSLAMGYLDSNLENDEVDLFVTILGERRRCRILGRAAVDPTGARMRS